MSDQPAIPPALHPFNLARALAGEALVTRRGRPATNFAPCVGTESGDCWTAYVDDEVWHYWKNGMLQARPRVPSDLDLFMASEAAEGKGYNPEDMKPTGRRYPSVEAMMKGEGFSEEIQVEVKRLVAKHSPAPPSPKSEAQGQVLRQPKFSIGSLQGHVDMSKNVYAETETQRQARIDKALASIPITVEQVEVFEKAFGPFERAMPEEARALLLKIKARLKPAPEKARRVWVTFATEKGRPINAYDKEPVHIPYPRREFIELTPAIRAELNAVLGSLCQFANATASGLALREVEHEAQTLLAKLPAIRAAVEREGL